ncbi:MAG: large conductance mechanosensitive channel protein MscL [Gaiellales bacterium]
MRGLLIGFREFVTRGNVVDLAVAVVIGAAFGVLIASLVEDLLTPLIAAIFGEPDFSELAFTLNGSTFRYGSFINALIAFTTVAASVYVVVVRPMRAYAERRDRDSEASTKTCEHCLSRIPGEARRCAFCTADLAGGPR